MEVCKVMINEKLMNIELVVAFSCYINFPRSNQPVIWSMPLYVYPFNTSSSASSSLSFSSLSFSCHYPAHIILISLLST